MTKIRIKKLSVKNFNGIASCELNFEDGLQQLVSPSGVGKTSIAQAIQYACGIEIPKIFPSIDKFIIKDLETKVELTLLVGEYDYVLTRSNKQKWVTDKFSGEKKFDGNTSECIFDGEPTSITIYKAKICSLFNNVDDKKLSLLLDVSAFNNMHWEDQRKILGELLNLDEIVEKLNQSEKFNLLTEDLSKGKSKVDIQKVLNVTKKNITDEQKQNQILIEDKLNQVTELSKIDFNEIEKRKEQLSQDKNKLVEQSKQANKNTLIEEKKLELEKLKSQYSKKQNEFSIEIDTHKEKERKYSNQINEISNDVYYLESRKKRTESEIEDLKMELDATKEEEFDKSKTVCPTCKRELEKEKINELLLNFQHQKENRLAEINSKVENQVKELQDIENRINTQKTEKEALEVKFESLKQVKFDNSEIEDLENKISQMQNEIQTLKAKEVESVVSSRIEELSEQYDECVRELTKKDLMIEIKNQIQNLKNRSKELANLDRDRILKQDQLFEYIKEKIAIVNKTVNENFKGVQFIFFTPLSSNADKPYEITCTIAFEGVEYQKCSTGQKILANCRVFEGLEKLLDVDTFKFIDERQSTTLDLEIGGQIIELITSDDKSKCNFKPTQIKDIYTIEDTDKKNF